MRTTLTLDDDVTAKLNELRRSEDRDLKSLVNEALRQGLAQLGRRPRRGRARTRAVSLGRCKVGSIDNIAEVLAIAEGDLRR
jgi:hypothetical protein